MTDTHTRRRDRQQTGTFRNAWTAFHVRGVPIRFDVSWLLIAGLFVYFFFNRFELLLGDRGMGVVLATAAVAAALFFASLLAHELGHALTSLDRDIPVLGVTLFLMGGVTESTQEARRARDEFVIVGIGPFISLVVGAAFGLLYTAVQGWAPAAVVTGYLAWTNVLLAVFNLVPGYPLDGGRLLRSILWWISGRPHASTRWAARVGQAFALGLVVLGMWTMWRTPGAFGGLWWILIGAFLYRGAAQSHQRARMSERLAVRSVRDTMGSVPPALDPQASLEAVTGRVQERPSLLWPVGVPVVGALRLDQIDAVPRDAWTTTRVADVASDPEGLLVEADTAMDTALDVMRSAPDNMVIVVEGGRPVGLLTASLVSDLLR